MRKFKRAMALTLVTAMAAASFVGCSKNSSSGSAAANNATKEVVTDASGKEVPLRDQIAAKKYDSEGKVLYGMMSSSTVLRITSRDMRR